MNEFTAELVGTAILILLGNGVVANVLLSRTKGHGPSWLTVSCGWAAGVFVAVLCVTDISGAHINPAVTIGLAAAGRFEWGAVPAYCAAQLIGASIGAALVYASYRPHYDATDAPDLKLATFCTAPAIRDYWSNLVVEIIATFVLVFAVLRMTAGAELGALGALPVALVVFAVGTSLGGPTGYAINPARDLGPRIAHALLPIRGKRGSDWPYAWIPVAGPVIGALLAAALNGGLSG